LCHFGDEEKIDFQRSKSRGLTTYREEQSKPYIYISISKNYDQDPRKVSGKRSKSNGIKDRSRGLRYEAREGVRE